MGQPRGTRGCLSLKDGQDARPHRIIYTLFLSFAINNAVDSGFTVYFRTYFSTFRISPTPRRGTADVSTLASSPSLSDRTKSFNASLRLFLKSLFLGSRSTSSVKSSMAGVRFFLSPTLDKGLGPEFACRCLLRDKRQDRIKIL